MGDNVNISAHYPVAGMSQPHYLPASNPSIGPAHWPVYPQVAMSPVTSLSSSVDPSLLSAQLSQMQISAVHNVSQYPLH